LLAAIFAEIPADSIWFSANRIGANIKNREILVKNMKSGSKTAV